MCTFLLASSTTWSNPGVYSYDDTSPNMHPWFPKYNAPFWKEYQEVVNLDEWEGTAGKPATKVACIIYDYLANFDGEAFGGIRVDIGDDPEDPDLNIAWKYLWTAKDTWLGPEPPRVKGGG